MLTESITSPADVRRAIRLTDTADKLADVLADVSTAVYGLEPVAPECLPLTLRGQLQQKAEAIVAEQMPLLRDRALSRTASRIQAWADFWNEGVLSQPMKDLIQQAATKAIDEYQRQLAIALREERGL
jgi:hypothetical protein